jgi:hypothetical protein
MLIFTLAHANSLSSTSNSSLCKNIFAVKTSYTSFPEDFIQPVREGIVKAVSKPSVRYEERIKTVDGDLLVFKLTGDSWFSVYAPVDNAFLGDPRWFSALFGSKVSTYFGFNFISNSEITAPTAARIESTISKLNLKLPENNKIGITFFETDNKDLDSKTYLTRFMNNSELPIAHAGQLSIHDISYHLSSIALPEYLIEQTKARIQLALEFSSWVNSQKDISTWEKYVLSDIATKLIESRARSLDIGTGNFGQVFLGFKNQWPKFTEDMLNSMVLKHFFKEGSTAISEIKDSISEIIDQRRMSWSRHENFVLKGQYPISIINTLGIKALINQFFESRDPDKHRVRSSLLPYDLRLLVDYKILAIKTATKSDSP